MYVDAKLIEGMIYVSAYKDGECEVTRHLPPYVFYYVDPNGKYTSIYGDKLHRTRNTVRHLHNRALKKRLKTTKASGIFESKIHPVNRLLEERYSNTGLPPLKVCVLDIEVDKDPDRGFSSVSNPYSEITAITIHKKWNDECCTLIVPPPTLTIGEAQELLANGDYPDEYGSMNLDNGYYLLETEAQLLEFFLEIIQDSDVLTGWNSEFYDIPYIVQRIRVAIGGEDYTTFAKEGGENAPFRPNRTSAKKLEMLNKFPCLPEFKQIEHYGKMETTYVLFGRIHLDYMKLYQKFNLKELHSYALDNVLHEEIKERKVVYSGSLDQLYRKDFRTFVAYNRQDVMGLSKMDDKLKFIELANEMAHLGGVVFHSVFGSVAIIQQAILKELHAQKKICFDAKEHEPEGAVPGAYVYNPTPGVYDWICSYDINSLYPSIIRTINISPECVLGQFDAKATTEAVNEYLRMGMTGTEAWAQFTGVLEYHYIMDETDNPITLFIEGGKSSDSMTHTGKEWKKKLRDENLSLSANGTVFQLDQEGIVSFCLSKWYSERVKFRKNASATMSKMEKETDPDKKAVLKIKYGQLDNKQKSLKNFLNSTYGAYLNEHFLFFDPRLGKSVTLSGRVIVKEMIKNANAEITRLVEMNSQ